MARIVTQRVIYGSDGVHNLLENLDESGNVVSVIDERLDVDKGVAPVQESVFQSRLKSRLTKNSEGGRDGN